MTKRPVPSLATVPVSAPAEPPAAHFDHVSGAVAPTRPARESLHVRVSAETVERVREAAHRLRRDKQDIAEEALRAWLDANGL
jgi:hypothetical protein